MRAPLLLTLAALAGVLAACGEPTLAQTQWEGTTRECGDPANDIVPVTYVISPEKFARVVTVLGYPTDEAGLPLQEACDSDQVLVDEAVDFSQTQQCQSFTISYTVDTQDDALDVSASGGLVGGTISFLRDDGTTDDCAVASQRIYLDP